MTSSHVALVNMGAPRRDAGSVWLYVGSVHHPRVHVKLDSQTQIRKWGKGGAEEHPKEIHFTHDDDTLPVTQLLTHPHMSMIMSDAAKSSSRSTGAKKDHAPEFNPRWKGYVFIALTSLVNFASISSIARSDRRTLWTASMTFGLTTFAFAVLVLVQDRSQRCMEHFNFTKAKDGYVEGGTLVLSVLWWIIGTGYTTHADGIAYVANNIYFSSWLALFSCIYTLNEWSASKDILSIKELTGLSATLKSWWVLNLTSLVVLGSCIDLNIRLAEDEIDDPQFGIAMSVVSFVISFFFILVHYDFIPQCEEGGWLELSSSFFLILLWTITLAVMTKDQGIAATVTGNKCSRDDLSLQVENCTIVVFEANDDGTYQRVEIACNDLPRQVPGSNLYFALWTCFFASLNISFRWKAQQALQFAQAQQEKRQRQLASTTRETTDNASVDGDDDDDEDVVEL